jgi:hypothetical protein
MTPTSLEGAFQASISESLPGVEAFFFDGFKSTGQWLLTSRPAAEEGRFSLNQTSRLFIFLTTFRIGFAA